MNCAEEVMKNGIEKAFPGRRITLTQVANITHALHGRTACTARHQCARGCSYGAYFSSLSSTLPAAQKTGKLTIVTDAVVESVLYHEKGGRASGVRVIDTKTGAS